MPAKYRPNVRYADQTTPEMWAAVDEALSKPSAALWSAIVSEFSGLGIHVEGGSLVRRYEAWQAHGRQVRRGERAAKVRVSFMWDEKGGERVQKQRWVYLFHVSQTDAAKDDKRKPVPQEPAPHEDAELLERRHHVLMYGSISHEIAAQTVQWLAAWFPNDDGEIVVPCAGLGTLADAVKERFPKRNLLCVENDKQRAAALLDAGHEVAEADWLQAEGECSAIVTMPPLYEGLAKTHVLQALLRIKPVEGLVVAILPFGADVVRELQEQLGLCGWADEFDKASAQATGWFRGKHLDVLTGTNVELRVVAFRRVAAAK